MTTGTTSQIVPPDLPTADVSFGGDSNLAGRGRDSSVRCNWPDLAGTSIAVLTTPADGSVLARIALRPDHVTVILGTAEGEYHERAFTGAGVTSFDPATGATVESTLTETAATPGTTPGSIGTVRAIHGTFHCGDQTAGSASLTITGETADGTLSAASLDPVRVECDASPGGDEVAASGITTVGANPVLVSIGLTSDGAVTIGKSTTAASRSYAAPGTATITSTGAHVRADVVEQGMPASPHVLHVEGDLSCGRYASG
jgi:hypothetical protein